MDENKKKRIPDIFSIMALFAIALFFFRNHIFTGKPFYGSDFLLQFYPWKQFILEQVREGGRLPFWNPYLFSGTPFVTNIQASMFYPPGFLYYILSPEIAYLYSTVLHITLGMVFMYGFMRTISISRWGASLSAVVFVFNGHLMGHLYAGHLSFIQAYIWIPIIYRYLYLFIRMNRFHYAVQAGLLLGLQILAGFPQLGFYTILSLFIFVLYYIFKSTKEGEFKTALRFASGIPVMLTISFCLAAVQVIPTYEFTQHSTRAGGIGYEMATFDSLHPKEILALLVPEFFGNPLDRTYWPSREGWHFWEVCAYVGLMPLFLIFIRRQSDFNRHIRKIFVVFILVSLTLALGKYNPVYPVIYRLPGFNSFRIPAQIIVLYVVGVAILAGMGMDGAGRKTWHLNRGFFIFLPLIGCLFLVLFIGLNFFPKQLLSYCFRTFAEGSLQKIDPIVFYQKLANHIERGVLILLGSCILYFLRKTDKIRPLIFNVLAFAFILTDLILFTGQFVRHYDYDKGWHEQRILSRLKGLPYHGRTHIQGGGFFPNDGLRYRIPTIIGYDPLILKRYAFYIQSSQNLKFDEHVVNLSWTGGSADKLIKLLNVRRITMGKEIRLLDDVIPYAHIVPNAVLKRDKETLPFMKSASFKPKNMVVLEPKYKHLLHPMEGGATSEGCCFVKEYGNESIRLVTRSNSDGYLVLSEIDYPGWKASVDKKAVPIMRGNYIFRVIPLEKGEHDIHLYFVSWPFRIGVFVSLLTLLTTLFILWSARKERI